MLSLAPTTAGPVGGKGLLSAERALGGKFVYFQPLSAFAGALPMRIQTISYLKQHAATLDLDEPLCITQNGLPTMVVQSYDQYRQTQEAIALVRLLSLSDKDVEGGQLISGSELLQKLVRRSPQTGS